MLRLHDPRQVFWTFKPKNAACLLLWQQTNKQTYDDVQQIDFSSIFHRPTGGGQKPKTIHWHNSFTSWYPSSQFSIFPTFPFNTQSNQTISLTGIRWTDEYKGFITQILIGFCVFLSFVFFFQKRTLKRLRFIPTKKKKDKAIESLIWLIFSRVFEIFFSPKND